MTDSPAISIDAVSHRYGERLALDRLSLAIESGEIFVLLGPNGGGKTTLFRLLSTLIPIQDGTIRIGGLDLRKDTAAVRRRLGVVFQAPSLDRRLTVAENLLHQGHLYGLSGSRLRNRSAEMLERLGIRDRAKDLVETLSGGLRRRVELAKGLLHSPEILLLDEPSTGLDPAARSDLWVYLKALRETDGVTVALTTHLLEEAEKADRIGILHQGRLVALDAPDRLKATIGGDTIAIESSDATGLAARINARFELAAGVVDGTVRIERSDGHEWVARLVEAFGPEIASIALAKPTLEDVFIARTGHRFWSIDAAHNA